MPRYNDLINSLGKSTIFCNNLGFGEQGSVLKNLPKSIFICPDSETCQKMKAQLKSLKRECAILNDFDKLFTFSKFQSNENKIKLLNAIYSLVKNDAIIISTPEILFSSIPNLETFEKNIISIDKLKEYDIIDLEKNLISIGYKKVETLTKAGEFVRRGDIIDIFNITSANPVRLDFFDTQIEEMDYFDCVSFEKLGKIQKVDIVPNKLNFFTAQEQKNILSNFSKLSIEENSIFDLISAVENHEDIPLEFVSNFVNVSTFTELNIPIIISNQIQVVNTYSKIHENLLSRITNLFKSKNMQNLFKNLKNLIKIDDFFNNFANDLVFFDNFDLNKTDLKNKFTANNLVSIDFKTHKLSNYLNNLTKLKEELTPHSNKQIYLCLNSVDTINSIKKIFNETNTTFSLNKNDKGIILTELDIPFNICFEDDDCWYIGSTNFAHKKEIKSNKKTSVKYLPKAGEYVVHSTHGIGRCEGLVTVKVSNFDKEFFKIVYRGGDILYVPYENADCLSLYMASNSTVNLNKLGGKEFAAQKLKAIKSIEDMSQELLELYAKRKAVKGFVYPEDDYLYTEFENSFEFTETADQLQAIQDIKNDMHSGKVMDRLICGDVGFGKTEVAIRALFKAVEAGKQVAVLAPTTILSLQHNMTISKRLKDFGIRVEMLNRFKSSKEQKQIIEDLKNNKLQVVCGTHRLLSKDVQFADLGLLILDEEHRFGVKAKEQIKQMKNNVNVLTLSATPIPRTLSMSLMAIRDISIINTAPVDRLAVKTYVVGYDENLISSAINEEINRGGQVLIVHNNIEQIYKLANRLKTTVNNDKAVFDVAHGQMSEIALENAIKRLYDKQTNVFVSTTLIENGIDLPKANTLIVIDSDHLGLSQMYQLRGRVGRSSEQAYAYFTFNKGKVLTEEATSRLQAIAENTELGSGFKIAMRDLQIRGAGELLGKTQHGHMIKIGYDLYTKLLNDTLRKLKGEKVEIERDIKIDIAIPSKIPYTFTADETERLKIIAKISNITNKDNARAVLNDLLAQYGKLPTEIYHLTNISLLKAVASKQKVKNITITASKMSISFYEDIDISKLMKKVNVFKNFKFEKGTTPTIALNTSEFSVQTALRYFLEFLQT